MPGGRDIVAHAAVVGRLDPSNAPRHPLDARRLAGRAWPRLPVRGAENRVLQRVCYRSAVACGGSDDSQSSGR